MKEFVRLFYNLDSTKSSLKKQEHLINFFKNSEPLDVMWCVSLFLGKRPKRILPLKTMRIWAGEAAGIDDWLFTDTYAVVGDLAETISLIIPKVNLSKEKLPSLYQLLSIEFERLRQGKLSQKREWIEDIWKTWRREECFVLNKLLSGGFRIGVSKGLVSKAIAKWLGIEPSEVANRLAGGVEVSKGGFEYLTAPMGEGEKVVSKPFPFYLAYGLEGSVEDLGACSEWTAEWKWDGIRAQVIKRGGEVFVWSRGEELITESMPDLLPSIESLPEGTVLDGELLVFDLISGEPKSFNHLQTRLGRRSVSTKLQKESPCALIAYDCLESGGKDIRNLSFNERRKILEKVCQLKDEQTRIFTRPQLSFDDWSDLENLWQQSRKHRAEGLMLKRNSSTYREGRKKGDWWKWKSQPLTLDFVLLYAKAGHGRRANLYTDYTLAAWDNEKLVPVTKAYSGLSDKEMGQLDRWIKKNTKERFGPVRSVEPVQVLEIAFEGISASKRHKSGWALRFPRIKRWRQDKLASEADTVDSVRVLYERLESGQ